MMLDDHIIDINKMPLRGLKIIRKNYRKNRRNPLYRERLEKINLLIAAKERKIADPKPMPTKEQLDAMRMQAIMKRR